MRFARFLKKSSIIALVSALYIADANAISWYRHIYNNTNVPWYFQITPSSGGFFTYCESNCKHGTDTYNNQNFIVDRGEIWATKMTSAAYLQRTNVKIIDQYGKSATYCFYVDYDSEYAIVAQHNGKTGGVLLNSPAGADVKLNDANVAPTGSSLCID